VRADLNVDGVARGGGSDAALDARVGRADARRGDEQVAGHPRHQAPGQVIDLVEDVVLDAEVAGDVEGAVGRVEVLRRLVVDEDRVAGEAVGRAAAERHGAGRGVEAQVGGVVRGGAAVEGDAVQAGGGAGGDAHGRPC